MWWYKVIRTGNHIFRRVLEGKDPVFLYLQHAAADARVVLVVVATKKVVDAKVVNHKLHYRRGNLLAVTIK